MGISMKYVYITLISLIVIFAFTNTEPPFVKLRNIEKAQGENYTILTDTNGVQQYVLQNTSSVDVNLVAINYVPTSSGNANNRNQIVTDPNGEIWSIDNDGDAVKLEANSSATPSSLAFYEENTFLSDEAVALKFVGSNVTATENNDTITVTVNDGGGGGNAASESVTLNASTSFSIKLNYTGTLISNITAASGVYTITIPSGCNPSSFIASWTDQDVKGDNGIEIRFQDTDSRQLWFQQDIFLIENGSQLVGAAGASVTPLQTFSGSTVTQTYSAVNETNGFRVLANFIY